MLKTLTLTTLLTLLTALGCTSADDATQSSSTTDEIELALSSSCPDGSSSCSGYCVTFSKKVGDQTKYGAANVASKSEALALLRSSGIRKATLYRGSCADQSTACTMDYRPVCGSIDGSDTATFGNECAFLVSVREAAGTSDKAVGLYSDGQCGATCNYNGVVYSEGDSWTADDGCNTCICGEDGLVGCTRMLCH